VLRGGAWNNNQNNARCAYRNRNNPHIRNNNIGLRLVSHILYPAGNVTGWPPGECVAEAQKMARPVCPACGVVPLGDIPAGRLAGVAWPEAAGAGRISNSHAPSGSSPSESWGVALFGDFFKLTMQFLHRFFKLVGYTEANKIETIINTFTRGNR
jgi:hypothetical protein